MARKGILLALFFLMTVLLPAGRSYAGRQALGDGKVLVLFDAPLRAPAREVFDVYPRIRAELREDLGWQSNFRTEIVLMKDSDSFREAAGSDLVAAFAVPREDLIVIDYTRMNIHPFALETTLKHELCHLELHHHIGEGGLPRWLDEGMCQWVTGGLSELATVGNRSLLRDAALSHRIVPIEGLANMFSSGGKDLLLAYEESRDLVAYINKEFGSSGVKGILERLSRGDDLEDAVRKSLLISPDEFERRWKASLTEHASWLAYIGDSLYEILFLCAALVTVYGFIRVFKKRREYRDEDEEDGGEGKQ